MLLNPFAFNPNSRRLPVISWRVIVATITVLLLGLLHAAPHAQAQNRWPDERQVPPFNCHADFSLEPYGLLFGELGQLERDLNLSLGIVKPREEVHVYLFGTKETYHTYMKQIFPEVPSRRALFMKARGPGMVFAYVNPEFDVDVRHECTHALLHASLPMVPLWLDEGLAEYFEVPRTDRASANPHLTSIRWKARLGGVPSIEELERKVDLAQMGRNDYRNSWAWVHFMMHGPQEAHDELVRYLADIQASAPAGNLSERLRRRIPDLDRRFADHFRGWD